jgi:hypothetical protein
MTPEQIAELYIKASEVDRRLPQTAKPARVKAMTLPFIHDQKDMNGWGAERYQEERADFFDARSTRLTKNQVAIWELSLEMIKLVRKPECRRALWAWASSKAGGMSVAKWSRTVENIHPETASRRAKSAIAEIHRKLSSKAEMHNENRSIDVLPFEPEMGDKTSNIEVWRPAESRPLACFFDTDIAGMEYADIANARRRERRARRQQAA